MASTSTTINVVIDMGTATALSAFATLNSSIANTPGPPTLTIKGADDSGITTNVVTAKAATTFNVTAPNHKDHVFVFPSATKRYWQLVWTWSGSSIYEVGEILAASTVTTLSRTSAYGSSEREEFILSQLAMENGDNRSHFLSGPIASRMLNFSELSAANREELMILHRATYGGALPLLWIDDVVSSASAGTAASQRCLYCRSRPQMDWTQTDFDVYGITGLELKGLPREIGA